jgi:rhamnosyl/mannosyltransferase
LPFPEEEEIARANKLWGTDKFKVLTIGRLTYYKGHENLIRAAANLPSVKVIIVGDGERSRQLHELIDSLQARDKIILAGGLPQHELNALLAACDCFCLPSIERTEAFGLVLLEAMRFGKPIVASDIPGSGVGFVVQNGKTGRLVPVGDGEILAQTLNQLAMDRSHAEKLGMAGKNRFEKHFHIQNIARTIKEIYTGLENNLISL